MEEPQGILLKEPPGKPFKNPPKISKKDPPGMLMEDPQRIILKEPPRHRCPSIAGEGEEPRLKPEQGLLISTNSNLKN